MQAGNRQQQQQQQQQQHAIFRHCRCIADLQTLAWPKVDETDHQIPQSSFCRRVPLNCFDIVLRRVPLSIDWPGNELWTILAFYYFFFGRQRKRHDMRLWRHPSAPPLLVTWWQTSRRQFIASSALVH